MCNGNKNLDNAAESNIFGCCSFGACHFVNQPQADNEIKLLVRHNRRKGMQHITVGDRSTVEGSE